MSASEPGKIITPWAESGLKNPIPPAANPATGRAGFDQGFSAINMTAKEAGGIPPFGQDFNGIFYEVTNILRYMQAGGQPTFDAALATAVGGYPKGAMVLGGDGVTLWQSKVDSNSTDPNTDPTDWGTFDIGLKADLAAPGGSDIVGFQQSGSGSVARTAQDKMREIVSVEDFGGADDLAKFTAAIAAGQYVAPTESTYSLSSVVEGNIIQFSRVEYIGSKPINRNVGYGCNVFSPAMTAAALNNTAIGDGVLSALVAGSGNTGVGRSALKSVTDGINNTAVGYNVMVNTTTAFNNTGVGRNALLENTTGSENCAFGWASQQRTTIGENNSSYGRSTLEFNVSGSFNNCLGATAMFNNVSGSYNQAVGCSALWTMTTGTENVGIGTDALYNANGTGNVGVGHRASRGVTGNYNVTLGRNTLETAGCSGSFNIAIGNAAMGQGAVTGVENTAIGQSSMLLLASGTQNTGVGSNALGKVTTGSQNTAIGNFSLNLDQSGANHNYTNATGVGHSTRVSGNDQVQLGNAATTTYVYGTVQNRSDAEDKTDVRDTQLGIEFIMGLRPVDGRWDMRDDYIEEYQVQVGIDDNAEPVFETRSRQLPKDGSKARTRFHHWFIAQEVKELCDKLGVDFGGYQDHSLSGGCDVKTLGYDEFIPPTVRAVQQCWTRLDELEKRIAALE